MHEARARPPSSPPPELDHRSRLIDGITAAVTQKGYAQVTIADVARLARVSKRTFYEHFADKEECFLAAYAALSDDLFERIASAAGSEPDVDERLESAIDAYVGALQEQPAVTRAFLTEIQAAGSKALIVRRAILGRYADLLRVLVDAARQQRPELAPLSPAMANAVVGGINELLLLTVEQGGGVSRLSEVGETARELIRAVLLQSPAPAPSEGARKRAKGTSRRSE